MAVTILKDGYLYLIKIPNNRNPKTAEFQLGSQHKFRLISDNSLIDFDSVDVLREMSISELKANFNQYVDISSHIHIGGVTEEVTGCNGNKIKFKDKAMKNNKHPHHDLIVEWAEDTSKVIQIKMHDGKWIVTEHPDWCEDLEYRFKPREFVKGHWYHCVNEKRRYTLNYNGESFCFTPDEPKICIMESEMSWIGESLGEIKFGGGE